MAGKSKPRRIAVLTSGGDSPGMNAGIRAAVRAAIDLGIAVTGVMRGYQGLIDGQFIEMDHHSVSGIINRGGTILLTARCKEFFEAAGRAKAVKRCRKAGIDGILAFGGDGTFRGAKKLSEESSLLVVGVPGTIDNDVPGTDSTIGFDTAVNTALEAVDRIRDTATSHERLFLIEVMGRSSGQIALHVALAGGAEGLLIPETPNDLEALAAELARGREKGKSSTLVVVAEGDEGGGAMAVASRLKELKPGYDIRVSILGHQQRGGAPTAFDRILASRLCSRGVEELAKGNSGVMVGVRKGKTVTSPLSVSWEGRKAGLPRELLDLHGRLSK